VTTATVRRRLVELEGALAQITTRAAERDGLSWLQWATNAELDELERLYRERAEYTDLDDLSQLRVIEIVAAATRREMAAAAREPH
jgi:hypothetical protein